MDDKSMTHLELPPPHPVYPASQLDGVKGEGWMINQ
jgi:hypothetical protein